jgi:hypothetical protein
MSPRYDYDKATIRVTTTKILLVLSYHKYIYTLPYALNSLNVIQHLVEDTCRSTLNIYYLLLSLFRMIILNTED